MISPLESCGPWGRPGSSPFAGRRQACLATMVFDNGRDAVLNQEQQAELDRLQKVLAVAQRNGNQLFIANIEREIAALERGEHSPLIHDYLTEAERSGSRPGQGG